jgi:Fe-S-cluster containining protein
MKTAESLIENDRIHFKCLNSHCPNNCCGPSFENSEGIIKAQPVFKVQRNTVPLTEFEAQEIIEKFGEDKLIKEECSGYHILCTNENGCIFFDKSASKCSIYKENFLSCKSYPFFYDKYWGLCIDDSCPGVGAGWTGLKDIKKMVAHLRKVYERQFEVAERALDSLESLD